MRGEILTDNLAMYRLFNRTISREWPNRQGAATGASNGCSRAGMWRCQSAETGKQANPASLDLSSGIEELERHNPQPKCSPAICVVIGSASTVATILIVWTLFNLFAK